MTVKRLISDEQRAKIKELKKFKGKKVKNLSKDEQEELLQLIADKLGLL